MPPSSSSVSSAASDASATGGGRWGRRCGFGHRRRGCGRNRIGHGSVLRTCCGRCGNGRVCGWGRRRHRCFFCRRGRRRRWRSGILRRRGRRRILGFGRRRGFNRRREAAAAAVRPQVLGPSARQVQPNAAPQVCAVRVQVRLGALRRHVARTHATAPQSECTALHCGARSCRGGTRADSPSPKPALPSAGSYCADGNAPQCPPASRPHKRGGGAA